MPRVEVVHAASPLCHWSWGYESVLSRLEALYGDQIDLTVTVGVPWTSRDRWLHDYGMTADEALDFTREVADAGGIPLRLPASWHELPESTVPPAIAVKAAGLVHGPRAERRLMRRLMFANFVEGRDTSDEGVLADVITALGLDLDGMMAVAGDESTRALEADAHRAGHGANFYSLIVRDNDGTTVTLERAYDPARVERAVEYLAGGGVDRREPTLDEVPEYVEEHGPVCAPEVARAFALPVKRAEAALADLERSGDAVGRDHAGVARFWSAP